ncbi:uncharacterized protein HHUB_6118 (plasmid) [Halobacterium hubeiense]|jgi:hypothetical protein|uniref:Uncharacterized protein n=1 Tax=Halobacterium hubeiense TaxID=1407499 RepID=A0A0U5AL90_9EURY|nr:hypothetical protein [Halobacterium salinarum]MCF2168229.1 hypothetical protein [Halobacterium salinarum]CQH65423.1 uncharacterized protein HHUB_6118 [Halobacterium hubeiense]
MILQALTTLPATALVFGLFSLFVLLAFAVAYAKRDVTIDITVFEFH